MEPMFYLLKYYRAESVALRILREHSEDVARKALSIARRHTELGVDLDFVREAAMLHDVGIFCCDAPEIDCHGSSPYICHGVWGAMLMRKEGFPRHALVCERHTGAGLSRADIRSGSLPLPERDMLPVSEEEQLICFADKFFSKTNLGQEKSVDKVRASMAKYGEASLARFDRWLTKYA